MAADSTVAKTEAKEESSLLKELDSLAPQNKPGAEVHDTSAMSAQYPLFAKLQPIVDQQGQLGAGPVVGRIVVRYRYGEPLPEPAAGEGAKCCAM